MRKTLVVDMDAHDDHAHRGAARRRWERRLRAFLRHGKLSLAMQMAAVSHHSQHRAGRADARDCFACRDLRSVCFSYYSDRIRGSSTYCHLCYFSSCVEHVAPAPVTQYIAPAPAVYYVASSQQLPPTFTATTDTTDDLDITGLVNLQFSELCFGDICATGP